METEAIAHLQAQLLKDMERFGDLMNRYTLGDVSVKTERDQLEGAVEVKLAILEGLKQRQDMEAANFFEEMDVLEEDVEEDEEW